MMSRLILSVLFVMLLSYTAVFAEANQSLLIAQFLTDDKEGAAPKQNDLSLKTESQQLRPRFILGLSATLSNLEGFANVSASSILGIQYGKFSFTADPAFIFSRAKSIKNKKNVLGPKSTGEILEFGFPVKCTYNFLDLSSYQFSPYLQAGFGYDLRKYHFSGSSFFIGTGNSYFIDSLTLNFGFGFLIKMTEQTRLRIGLGGISYFSSKEGKFGYETTGASLLLGLTTIFD